MAMPKFWGFIRHDGMSEVKRYFDEFEISALSARPDVKTIVPVFEVAGWPEAEKRVKHFAAAETREGYSLAGKNIVIYDLEIRKEIEECSRGWESLDEMGISVGCAYDYRESRCRVFMEDNLGELVTRLNEPGTLVVAFNHVGFDNKLLRASGYALKPDEQLRNYDMLVISKAGAKAEKYASGFKLDDHLKALGLPMKTGSGAMAPVLWKAGKMGALVDYCLNDVTQERALFEHIVRDGTLACRFRESAYDVERPDLFGGSTMIEGPDSSDVGEDIPAAAL
jgi:hypothetical protein